MNDDRVGSGETPELSVLKPAAGVSVDQAERGIDLSAALAERIDHVASRFIDELVVLDPSGAEFQRRVDEVRHLAQREVWASSEVTKRVLDIPRRAAGVLVGGDLEIRLVTLRRWVGELTPSDPMRRYRRGFDRARRHVEECVGALHDGIAEVQKENAVIAQEQTALQMQTQTMSEYAYLAARLETGLEQRIASLQAGDPARARALQQDALFAARARHHEILTHLAMAMQGLAALHLVAMNNRELSRAVKATTTAAMFALRTAALVAQSLKLRDQLMDVDVAAMQRAWGQVVLDLNEFDIYRTQALVAMQTTVSDLTSQTRGLPDVGGRERADSTQSDSTLLLSKGDRDAKPES